MQLRTHLSIAQWERHFHQKTAATATAAAAPATTSEATVNNISNSFKPFYSTS